MSWTLSEKEIQSLLILPGAKRYEYLIKKVADQAQAWSLWQNGWALACDDAGHEIVPIWPHSKYAELCATGRWAGYVPKVIDLAVFMERWISGMEKDKRQVVAFPTPSDKGIIVEPRKLESDLREEQSQYQ